jgi:predicted signal transduction protein with EAL and GGDEF domain
MLRAVAAALANCTSAERPVIRLGGDEFVLIAEVDSPTDAALIAHEVQVLLSDLGSHHDERFPPIGASFGISLSPHDGSEPDALLAAADFALHDAKRRGRGRVEFYRPELRSESERRSAIDDALRSAVPDLEMELHLQPICALDTPGAVWGVEALLRWRHPVLGNVSPVEFIPIAEQCGQIVPMGRWVLARAASIAAELNAERAHPLRVCVNVSTRQFTLDDVVDAITDALRVSGCDSAWLQLELTESLLLEDLPLVRDAIDRLRSLGVGIAIDDFGTGYSALHYLTKLPIDHMKIDKSFVRDVEVDAQQQEVVRALIALASAIDVEVVAEGIETDGQAEFLRAMGCGLGQGFLLATPMRYPQLISWLAQHETVVGRVGPA